MGGAAFYLSEMEHLVLLVGESVQAAFEPSLIVEDFHPLVRGLGCVGYRLAVCDGERRRASQTVEHKMSGDGHRPCFDRPQTVEIVAQCPQFEQYVLGYVLGGVVVKTVRPCFGLYATSQVWDDMFELLLLHFFAFSMDRRTWEEIMDKVNFR